MSIVKQQPPQHSNSFQAYGVACGVVIGGWSVTHHWHVALPACGYLRVADTCQHCEPTNSCNRLVPTTLTTPFLQTTSCCMLTYFSHAHCGTENINIARTSSNSASNMIHVHTETLPAATTAQTQAAQQRLLAQTNPAAGPAAVPSNTTRCLAQTTQAHTARSDNSPKPSSSAATLTSL